MEKHILEKLYRQYTKPLYLYIFSLCGNHALAEDIMQETFLKAFLNLEHTREEMLPWLFRVAKNMYIDTVRKEKNREHGELDGQMAAKDAEVPDQIIAKEQNRRLYRAICTLEEREKEIVLLYYFGGVSQKEIARQLALSAGNVRVMLHRIKKKLYEQMKEVSL